MPEGPSIVIFKEELEQFIGKKILSATGNAGIDMKRLVGKKIVRMTTWGKHLLFCFDDFTIRIHFLMFGKYFINSSKDLTPRLCLKFPKGEQLNIYTSAVRIIDEPLDEVYDWSLDIMSPDWDINVPRNKLKNVGDILIADALMDQEIFPGLGNIIKSEVLYRTRIHPKSLTGNIPAAKITELLKEIRKYAFEFYEWRKIGKLAAHWEAYKKKICKRDGMRLRLENFGTAKRRTFFCSKCQRRY